MKKTVFIFIAMLFTNNAHASDVNINEVLDILVQQENAKIEMMRDLYSY